MCTKFNVATGGISTTFQNNAVIISMSTQDLINSISPLLLVLR